MARIPYVRGGTYRSHRCRCRSAAREEPEAKLTREEIVDGLRAFAQGAAWGLVAFLAVLLFQHS